MKILTGDQIRELDRYTIEHEPIDSINLMERAAEMIAQSICGIVEEGGHLVFFIGKGNNGGDGLAVARMLSRIGYRCSIYKLFPSTEFSDDALFNLERLPEEVEFIEHGDFELNGDMTIVDAILGSGAHGVVSGLVLDAIKTINSSPCRVISIDLPSGMKSEFGNTASEIVSADRTLTLEFPKLAMLLPEAGECCGEIEILPIELHPDFIRESRTDYFYLDKELIQNFILTRGKFSHKGNYGHTLLVCGSSTMLGASILATSAALRSGCGLVTTHVPEKYASAMYASAPSAMLSLDDNDFFTMLPSDLERFNVCGVGCGVGEKEQSALALKTLLNSFNKPMVIDADALNLIASSPELLELIPKHSVLTPHLGELERLIGKWSGEESKKIELVRGLAKKLNCVVVVKGAHTMICLEDGRLFFNSTGSCGMAKGGSGDVLTGFIAGLIARGYSPGQGAILGVYAHGLAGEKAAEYYGIEGMNSGDLCDFLGEALSDVI